MSCRRPAAVETITIPGYLPTPLNVLMRRHYQRRAATMRKEAELVVHYLRSGSSTAAVGKRRVSLLLTLQGQDKVRDPDANWKVILDACVSSGRLVDDGPKWCELGSVNYGRGPKRATTIILEDIEAAP